jgi:hypothetical protein
MPLADHVDHHEVQVIDNLTSGNIRNLTPVIQKIAYAPSLETLTDSDFDGVFHLGDGLRGDEDGIRRNTDPRGLPA